MASAGARAVIAAARGDVARATRLLGAASVLDRAPGPPSHFDLRQRYDRAIDIARDTLGDAAFAAAWAEGEALSLEEAVAAVLAPDESIDP